MKISFKVIFILFISIWAVLHFASAVCTPEYKCSVWSSCDSQGFESRTCTDIACGQPDILDRKVCSSTPKGTCTPNYQCTDWTSCTYYDKTNDILASKIRYSGVQSRSCTDANGCADNFSEEQPCSDSFKVSFAKVTQCGQTFLVAQDPGTSRPVAQTSLDAWRQQVLDISFVQSNFSYCPSCYDGIQDSGETGIDCGGPCKPCGPKDQNFTPYILASWALALGLFFSFAGTFIGDPKYKLRLALIKAYSAMEKNDTHTLRKVSKHVFSIYLSLTPKQQEKFVKEIARFRARLADFRIHSSKEFREPA